MRSRWAAKACASGSSRSSPISSSSKRSGMRHTVACGTVATKAAELITVPGPDGPREVRLTSPDKVYFPEPGITKREVVEYYRAVVDALLGVLRERPTNLKRDPDGVTGEPFYSKRLPKGARSEERRVGKECRS